MKFRHAVVVLLLLMTFLGAVSWLKWVNPAIDSGREMNVPLRLLRGEFLYSQVYYLYGPIAPFFNALLYRLFGIHIGVLYVAGAAGSLLLVLLIYYLGRIFLSTYEAMLAGAAVLLLCVFKQGGNTIFPYSFAVLYGILLGTASLIAQVLYVRSRRKILLLAAGALCGLALCCKLEFGFAASASLFAVIISAGKERRMTDALLSLAALLAFPLLIYSSIRIPAESLLKDGFYLPGHIPAELIYFNKLKLGLHNPARTFREMTSALALLGGVTGAILLAGTRLAGEPFDFSQTESGRRLRRILYLTLASWIFLLIHVLIFGTHWDMNPFRALPILFLGMIFGCMKSRGSSGEIETTSRSLLAVSVFSLVVLARVITRVPAGGAYGADLLPIPLLLFVFMAMSAPQYLASSPSAGRHGRRIVAWILSAALISTTGIIAFRYTKYPYFRLHTPRGDMRLPSTVALAMNQAIDYINRNSSPGEPILALPEGSALNFLSDRPVPLRHDILTPGFLNEQAERQAISIIQEKNVRLIFLFNRPTTEFGAKAFGQDYCRAMMKWIDENCALAAVFGDRVSPEAEIGSSQFFIKCYRRRMPAPEAAL